MTRARALAATAAAVAVSFGVAAPAAHASVHAKPGGETCAQQQAQVDRATEALSRVTAVFEQQKTKIERLRDRLAAATSPEEQARIQARLDKALTQKQHDRKAKKAQLQRLAKAQERLSACQAGSGG